MSKNIKTALITGASSGIGAATARNLAKHGMKVIITARREEKLLGLQSEINANGGKADAFPADLTQEEERQSLFNNIQNNYGEVDLLVNNAGVGWYGYYSDMAWKTARDMMALNVNACVHLTNLFLSGMRERGSGHIINIGSISGSFPNQGVAIYSATKAFLDAFTSALFRELQGTRIRISVVRAGPVLTEFCQSAAQMEGGRHLPTEYIGVTAEKVAKRIWKLINHPQKVIYIPSYLRITPWIELCFSWLIDRLGPLLLKYRSQ